MIFLEICIFSGVFIATYFGVRWYRALSLKRGLLDHPNERSSHVEPTPRGGGIIIAIVVLAVYAGASWLISYEVSIGFATGAILIVAISLLDDIYSVSFAWRLLVHSVAAGIVVYSCGHITFTDTSGPWATTAEWIGRALTFAWIVWTLNAYNFMDGIDGIAGVQGVTAAAGWTMVAVYLGQPAVLMLSGAVLFASLAFLMHNWPPARIFMGDAGSAFLGFVLASMPFIVRPSGPVSTNRLVIVAVALLWLFIFDSVFTFIRRAARREKVWNAHREHLYQRLVRSGYSHRTVTLLYGGLSVIASAAAVFSLMSGSAFGNLVIIFTLASISLTVIVLCWKRGCLFGQSV